MKSFTKAILICLLVVCTLQPVPTMVSAQGESWLDGWDMRSTVSIIGSSGADTDYQVALTVPYYGFMQTDFDDLRFTSSDGVTEYDYWIETYVSADYAFVWVEVGANLSINQTIYAYYGNGAVSTTSNGDETFLLFDDFATLDAGKWSWSGAAVSGGELILETSEWIKSDVTFDPATAIEARSKQAATSRHNFGYASDWPAVGAMWIQHNSDGDAYTYEGNTDEGTLLYPDGVYCIQSLYWKDVDEGAYDINRAAIEHRDDADIPDDTMYAGIQLWGSSGTNYYADWFFVRSWIEAEPVAFFGAWTSVNTADFVFPVGWNPAQQFGYDAFFIFLGLIMMPISTMYLVRGGRKDMSTDKLFFGLIIFALGFGFLIGGIIP